MTTTVSFATRDCLVMGCDSLATSTQKMISPSKIWKHFFDNDGNLIFNGEGEPSIKSFGDLYNLNEY